MAPAAGTTSAIVSWAANQKNITGAFETVFRGCENISETDAYYQCERQFEIWSLP
jgi:hypothetical protein